MAVKLNQNLNQSQFLTISPRLQQSIKLLTMAHMEMTQAISKEMMENPLLEEREQETDRKTEEWQEDQKEVSLEKFDPEPLFKNKNDDFDWNGYVESFNSSFQYSARPKMNEENKYDYENIVTKGRTLSEHLSWQLRMKELSREDEEFCLLAIHNIDDDGRLDCSFRELLKETGLAEKKGKISFGNGSAIGSCGLRGGRPRPMSIGTGKGLFDVFSLVGIGCHQTFARCPGERLYQNYPGYRILPRSGGGGGTCVAGFSSKAGQINLRAGNLLYRSRYPC